jgi:hypothetical protein
MYYATTPSWSEKLLEYEVCIVLYLGYLKYGTRNSVHYTSLLHPLKYEASY